MAFVPKFDFVGQLSDFIVWPYQKLGKGHETSIRSHVVKNSYCLRDCFNMTGDG